MPNHSWRGRADANIVCARGLGFKHLEWYLRAAVGLRPQDVEHFQTRCHLNGRTQCHISMHAGLRKSQPSQLLGATMIRLVVLVLLTAVTALGAHVSTPSGPSNSVPVTFNKDVLPILQNNCQVCHRPGDVAPMSFVTYESTRKRRTALIPIEEQPPCHRARAWCEKKGGRRKPPGFLV